MPDENKVEFIARLTPLAKKVAGESGMSYELILAQAAQETGWGEKVLPGTNNIFNIKADSSWTGEKKTFNVWEIRGGKKVWEDAAFRVYGSEEEALRDRVKFLQENPRYADMFKDGVKGNFEKEADALQKAGYATDPNYSQSLKAVFDGPTMSAGLKAAAKANSPQEKSQATPATETAPAATPDAVLQSPSDKQQNQAGAASLSVTGNVGTPALMSPASLALLQDSERHVRHIADKHQLPWDTGMNNTVSAMACCAKEAGMTAITHFKVSDGSLRFAQHDGYGLKEASLDARVAANTPATQSVERLEALDHADQLPSQHQAPQRTLEPAFAQAR